MVEIKFLGRGGQGAVVAAQILATAFFLKGFYPQCYSLFGGERRGAPVKSFLRVDSKKILFRCEIKKADHLILMANDLLHEEPPLTHVKEDGIILVNSEKSINIHGPVKVFYVDAEKISRQCGLGNIINTAMLGAYCRISRLIPLEYLERAVVRYFPKRIDENLLAMRRAYDEVGSL